MTAPTLPRHIAIIMDGNGRWALQRTLPRIAGHKAGVDAVKQVIKNCVEHKIQALTLFAFSSENWRRPLSEVNFLMSLFVHVLQKEMKKLHEQKIQLRIIGDRSKFDAKLQKQMEKAEKLTKDNTGLKLIIAANYGGQWDIVEALHSIVSDIEQGKITSKDISPNLIRSKLVLPDLPEPDLLIRTSGEQRISNFLLWQMAYTELYFPTVFWPDFNDLEFKKALDFYANRERRFGYTSEQIRENNYA